MSSVLFDVDDEQPLKVNNIIKIIIIFFFNNFFPPNKIIVYIYKFGKLYKIFIIRKLRCAVAQRS
jgi:hypothetical protein